MMINISTLIKRKIYMQTHYDRTLNEKKKGKEMYLTRKESKGRWGKETEKEKKNKRGRRRKERVVAVREEGR